MNDIKLSINYILKSKLNQTTNENNHINKSLSSTLNLILRTNKINSSKMKRWVKMNDTKLSINYILKFKLNQTTNDNNHVSKSLSSTLNSILITNQINSRNTKHWVKINGPNNFPLHVQLECIWILKSVTPRPIIGHGKSGRELAICHYLNIRIVRSHLMKPSRIDKCLFLFNSRKKE